MATKSTRGEEKFSDVVFLDKPTFLNESCSNLCIKVFSFDKIIVGNESGCFITSLINKKGIFHEISRLNQKEVTSIEVLDENTFSAAFDKEIHVFDYRTSLSESVNSFNENLDEINQIKINYDKVTLASCDDAGEIKLFDLRQNKLAKTLRRRHTNICSCVSFIHGKQHEIITAGLDSQIIRWDFSRVKPLQFVSTQKILKEMGDDSVYMFNPPLVHSIDVSQEAMFVASGLGNGTLQIFQLMKGSLGLKPTFLINKHSTLGIPTLCYVKTSSATELLLTGGNDGVINLWDIPMNVYKNKSKMIIPVNKVSTDREIENFLLSSFQNKSKISSLDTVAIDGKIHVVFTDQTSTVKFLNII